MSLVRSGPVFSNVSIMKRAILQSNIRALPAPELELALSLQWKTGNSMPPAELVAMALHARKSYFEEDGETGLWRVKLLMDNELDGVEQLLKQTWTPFTSAEIARKLKIPDKRELESKLLADIRFSQLGNDYWLLSEWELLNNLAYEYMQKKRIESAIRDDLFEAVIHEHHLDKTIIVFAPEADLRFRVNRRRVSIELLEEYGQPEEVVIVIPEEVREEIARNSVLIVKYLNGRDHLSSEQIVSDLLGINPVEMKFAVYCRAVDEFLGELTFAEKSSGQWHISNHEPINVKLNDSWQYAVRGSAPLIQLGSVELNDSDSQTAEKSTNDAEGSGDTPRRKTFTHVVTYYERVRSYILVPKGLAEYLDTYTDGPVEISVNNNRYIVHRQKQDGRAYFYGSGISDLLFDYEVEPGQKLNISIQDTTGITIEIGPLDERYAVEQARYFDIGRLVEESRAVNKSYFALMCEVLAVYPSGLHWTRLFDLVSARRSASRSTIQNLLSSNPCFQQVEKKKGYWQLDVRKLTRYYTNEEGQQSCDEDFTPQKDHKPTSNKRKETGIQHPLPELQVTFKSWAQRQRKRSYASLKSAAANEQELFHLVVQAYTRMLFRLAEKRKSHSIEIMDLVQEGIFGLRKAVKLYNGTRPFTWYAQVRAYQQMQAFRVDKKGLIAIPRHLTERIVREERDYWKSVAQSGFDGVMHLSDLDYAATIFKTDFVSFEEYWHALENDIWSNIETPWQEIEEFSESNIGEEIHAEELLLQLNILCDQEEVENTAFISEDIAVNAILKNDLKERINNLLELLDDRERFIMQKRFGLIDGQEQTLEVVGNMLGLTRERVRQLEIRAISKLKSGARKQQLHVYLDGDILS